LILNTLLCGLIEAKNVPAIEIRRVTENSRKTDPHTLFVCIQGANADGHRFAASAYANGCRAFVAMIPLSLPEDAFVVLVPDTRRALALLAARIWGEPSRAMHVIGITGTKGKTTAAQLLTHILNRCGTPCGYIGTNGIFYAGKRLETCNTTPDAVTLQKNLHHMREAGVDTVVMEVSSQAMMQSRVDGIAFRTLIFTNLSPDHIGQNEHPDFAHYKACKQRLFRNFGAQNVVYNLDDTASDDMISCSDAEVRISCSTERCDADFYATACELLRKRDMWGISCNVTTDATVETLCLPLIGRFNISNALLAIGCACRVFGVELKHACDVLSNASVMGRSELIPLPNGACAVIDYAHNRASLEGLLTSLREYAPTRLIALFGSVGGRSQMRRRELGEVAAALCDLCILTSDNPANEPPMQIIDDIAQAFVGTSVPYLKIADRTEAIREAVKRTRCGDILVLAGKGHECYQLIGEEKLPFCEREILLDAIKTDLAVQTI